MNLYILYSIISFVTTCVFIHIFVLLWNYFMCYNCCYCNKNIIQTNYINRKGINHFKSLIFIDFYRIVFLNLI